MPWGDLYTIRGVVTQWDKKYKYLQLCVSRPGLFGATLLKEACRSAGITVTGKIRKGIASPQFRLLHTIRTGAVTEAVRNLNQESNNVVAELLNKNLGAYFDSPPGTRSKGLAIMRDFCRQHLGFKKEAFVIADASGLSPASRLSPRQFTRALNFFYRQLGDTFVQTLAPQGHHIHAMNPIPPEGMRVFVKSGTLSATGVNSVVGYIFLEKRKQIVSFALLANRRTKGPMAYSGTFTIPILSAILDQLSY